MSVFDWFFRTGSWVEEEMFQLLKNTPIFEGLNPSGYQKLGNIIHESEYSETERIFTEGDPSNALYIIREGAVCLFREDASENRVDLHTITEGNFFGELALCEGIERSSSAEADTNLVLVGFFREELEEFILKEPASGLAIYRNIVQVLGDRLYQANDRLESMTTELELIRQDYQELTKKIENE